MAVRWAAREAAMRNVALTLVHVALPAPVGAVPVTWPAAPTPDVVLQRRDEEARNVIADAIAVLDDSVAEGVRPAFSDELLFGRPVPSLVDMSKDAQMVVVGSRGRSALRRGLLGSVSSGLIHHAHCPVAVVHDDVPPSSASAQAPVLLGVDGSSASELATAIAFDEACRRGVDLIVVHVWSDGDLPAAPDAEWSDLESAAMSTLAESLAGWQERYPDVKVHRFIEFEHPARHLLDQSERAQLVVVGSHGRGGFAGMLLGSVSNAVAQAARVPVIVARQQ
jgi:nucleotide-binding universal stress UspA family protein